MQKKYSRNHNVVTFQLGKIVTLRISKKDRASTDNHRLICMVKDILHHGRHLLQTQFGVLDRLYPTWELNVVPEVDQTALCSEFENAPSKTITLHALAAKVETSNKVAVSCTCKKTGSPKPRCNCQKRKLECTQYCHSSARDCENMGMMHPIHGGSSSMDVIASSMDIYPIHGWAHYFFGTFHPSCRGRVYQPEKNLWIVDQFHGWRPRFGG